MDTDACTTGQIVDGFIRGVPAAFFFFGCFAIWLFRKEKNYEDQLAMECNRLARYQAEKAGHKISPEGVTIGRKLALKDRHRLSDSQKTIVDWYEQNCLGTKQATKEIEHNPPAEGGPFRFVPDSPDGLVWHSLDGRIKSAGNPSPIVAFHG